MKTLKLTLAFLAGFAILSTFSACNDDDKLPKDPFVGSWKLIEHGASNNTMQSGDDGEIMTLYEEGGVYYNWMPYALMMGTPYYEVKKDGFYMYTKMKDKTTWERYDYEITAKTLKLTFVEYSEPDGGREGIYNIRLYKRTANRE